ncbi:MAG: hypothetical protein AB1938_32870, partial [Myxococcota bacterium]
MSTTRARFVTHLIGALVLLSTLGCPGAADLPLTAPTGLTVTPSSPHSVNVRWNASARADSYGVYRDGAALRTVSMLALADEGLSPSTKYCYTVTAIANGVESPQSAPVCATTPADTGSFTLTVLKSGMGLGTVTGPGLDCGTTCTASVPAGTPVTLTAVPEAGSTFTGWSGCDTANGASCTVTLSADRTVTADFTLTGAGG